MKMLQRLTFACWRFLFALPNLLTSFVLNPRITDNLTKIFNKFNKRRQCQTQNNGLHHQSGLVIGVRLGVWSASSWLAKACRKPVKQSSVTGSDISRKRLPHHRVQLYRTNSDYNRQHSILFLYCSSTVWALHFCCKKSIFCHRPSTIFVTAVPLTMTPVLFTCIHRNSVRLLK